ncbi:MAG: 7-cyano-7-deazaguanine synthase [Pirellulales bacterium]
MALDYSTTSSCYDPNPATGKPCCRCDACLCRSADFGKTARPIRKL